MNVLDLIKTKTIRNQRLNAAQFLMAKAYRGVAYVDAHHDSPETSKEPKHLTYRGHQYDH